jgi:hypothetical protein
MGPIAFRAEGVLNQQGPDSHTALTSCSGTPGVVGLNGEGVQFAKELLALTDEEPVSSEARDRRHGATELIGQWAND